jgi:ATP-dependent DNA ligase
MTANAYLRGMFVPTRAKDVPDGPDWLREVKYDGYRLCVERDGDRVRLITRGGYNWARRYPWVDIYESLLGFRQDEVQRFAQSGVI